MKFFPDTVTGAGSRNDRINNNRGIATASSKAVCTCDPHNKCACAALDLGNRGKKKVHSTNAPTIVPAYNNATTATVFTEPPKDANVSAERGEASSNL
jgi:hypothetical protein